MFVGESRLGGMGGRKRRTGRRATPGHNWSCEDHGSNVGDSKESWGPKGQRDHQDTEIGPCPDMPIKAATLEMVKRAGAQRAKETTEIGPCPGMPMMAATLVSCRELQKDKKDDSAARAVVARQHVR